jgi:hypothetical protein
MVGTVSEPYRFILMGERANDVSLESFTESGKIVLYGWEASVLEVR